MRVCPSCSSENHIKSGIINNRQRYKCKDCNYFFTVDKIGKKIDDYYVNKALQLYLEGLTYREIERILGISHVSILNWVKKYNIKRPSNTKYHPTYKILNAVELGEYFSNPLNIKGAGAVVTELGDKFMLIQWERFRD
ncbi:IS1/IS1595 family N-terminal zinc-binding domain-containing protein [Nonlabens ulvanivorans]|uniref:Homeodomain-like domain-containing protein n=1 Tax=Nonlabens ulvanivorans TaxID=906888 RepID=A0A084JYM6_NONUL|nr:helix-turn-helix domain-containing protein [Nonlabens ulvanivorans]KEZ94060.1 transposase [Nonlabens ulvanivorans]PRX13046.1 Homeodomain-like domain-containing protein [Nonlabens ulvanivorans]WOI21862.1 helix-turn-helix domain-containing protein [Nonlabens ulvanivorans]